MACGNPSPASDGCWNRPDNEQCSADYECQNNFCCGPAASAACQPEWYQVATPTSENLLDIWGESSSDMWAVGGDVLRFNGTSWAVLSGAAIPAGMDGATAVSGFGTTVIVIAHDAGTGSQTLFEWNGTSFELATFDAAVPSPHSLNDVWVVSATEAYAVGVGGLLLKRTPGAWVLDDDPGSPVTTDNLNSLWRDSTSGKLYAAGGSTGCCDPLTSPCPCVTSTSIVLEGTPSAVPTQQTAWRSLGIQSDVSAGEIKAIVTYQGNILASYQGDCYAWTYARPIAGGSWSTASDGTVYSWADDNYALGSNPVGCPVINGASFVRRSGNEVVRAQYPASYRTQQFWAPSGCDLWAVGIGGLAVRR